MSSPTVSVVLPTYDRSWIVPRAIESVLAQEFESFELIVVDDGSTDDTIDMLRSFSDPRIKVIEAEHKGPAAARNVGIRAATGKYLTFIDSDDEYLPGKLRAQVELFEHGNDPNLGVLVCDADVITDVGTATQACTLRGSPIEQLLSFEPGSNCATPLLMIRRELMTEDLLFDESLIASEDRDLLLRLALHYRVDGLSSTLVRLNRRSAWSHRGDLVTYGREQLMLKHAALYEEYPQARYMAHRRIALRFLRDGHRHRFREHMRAALATGHGTLVDRVSVWGSSIPMAPRKALHRSVQMTDPSISGSPGAPPETA